MSIIVIHENAGRGCAIFGLGAFARVAGRLGVGCFEYRTAFPNLLGLLARWSSRALQACKQSARCLTDGFQSLSLSASKRGLVAVADGSNSEGKYQCPTKSLKDLTRCL
jgi:hypothetical protein